MESEASITVEICLGSSCFARGNRTAVAMVQEFISQHNLAGRILLKGALCQGLCKDGPAVSINGKKYTGVDSATLLDLLNDHLRG